MRGKRIERRKTVLVAAVALAMGFLFVSTQRRPGVSPGSPELVSIQPLPDRSEMCLWEPQPAGRERINASQENNLFGAFAQGSVYAAAEGAGQTGDVARPPLRKVMDTDPIYTAVTVDTRLNEVLLQDTNTWSIRVFNRLDNSPASADRTEPKRVIGGPKTDVQFNSCVYVDPKNGDIYSVENDIGDSIVVFSHNAEGDVEPIRKLKITHRGYAMTVDEDAEELFLSVQYPPQVAVYRKTASGDDKPLRLLKGESTRLSDAHGIAIDPKRKLLFVNNWGNISDYSIAGTGRFEAPSISVYPLNADGDMPPLRVIQGSRTQLNWPGAMSVDPERSELYVANDAGNAIIVFRETDQGNVQPARILKGSKTGISYPTGVFVDTKNKELWVSNLGNASATVYPLTASGDTAPLRTIRSAPAGKVSLRFGKTQAVAYDSKREEILVPNSVTHPQIAAFARLAKENTPPVRALEGQKTMISRTMHGFGYDAIHDEIVVTSPLTQAILIFRGSAKGEEPPVRVIQGPHTQILGTAAGGLDKVSVDPVNNESLLPIAPGGILVFDRAANGDVAPKRMLGGSDTRIRGMSPVAVDAMHNLLIVNSGGAMLIFDRTASGNAKPKAVIEGPKSLMAGISTIQTYPPNGWIIGGCDRAPGMAGSSPAICAWSINDNGDVPPRWKIPVQQLSGYAPSGIALDPAHREIIMSAAGQRIRPPSGIMNAVITFSWPEIF